MQTKQQLSILFVFHEAERTGASLVLLRYIQGLSRQKAYRFTFLLKYTGPLEADLSYLGEVLHQGSYITRPQLSLFSRVINKLTGRKPVGVERNKLAGRAFDAIIANTLVAAPIILELKTFLDAPVGWFIHELQLAEKKIAGTYETVLPLIDVWIANSGSTANFIKGRFHVAEKDMVVHYPPVMIAQSGASIRQPEDKTFVIGSVGTAIPRKGCDLFIMLALQVRRKFPASKFKFVWVGNSSYFRDEIAYDIQQSGLEDILEFTGETDNPGAYYERFDVFVSTSKEESFGLACMEAASNGIPVAGFRGTAELEKLIEGCGGILVNYMDIETLADSLVDLASNDDLRSRMAISSKQFAEAFTSDKLFSDFAETINRLALLNTNHPEEVR